MTDTTYFPPPISRDELDDDTFDTIMARGLSEAKAGLAQPVAESFAAIRRELGFEEG